MTRSPLAVAVITVLITCASPIQASDYFDPALLSLIGGQAAVTDLSAFETAGHIPPGTYLVTLFVNQQERGQYPVVFGGPDAQPELTPAFLAEAGVNTAALPAFIGLPQNKPVADLTALIPDARVIFDFSQQRLDLSIPQVAMKPHARGAAEPALWDDGVPAFLLSYTLNAGRNHRLGTYGLSGSDQTSLFTGFRTGLNWQAWRLRSDINHTRNVSRGYGRMQRYDRTTFSNTYLQRDIRAWRTEFLAGENSTGSDVFDSVPFRGVKLSSSEDMLPVSLRGFAPVIAGIAQSNARVTVTQNGNVVYQTYVAPGPFRLNDLYQTGQGGDLTVTVTEADGSVRTWTQAFSALPVMLRPGGLKYELTAGRYHGGVAYSSREADFALGTLIYGLPSDVTLYGGGLAAKDYLSAVIGSGVSLGYFGALSADITTSSASLYSGQRHNGQSYRMRYGKSLLSTGTSIDLTAYRYSTRHYYSFADFNNTGHRLSDDQVPWALARQRSEFHVRVSQQFGDYGSLYLTGSRRDYWNHEDTGTTLSAGYNTAVKGVSLGLAYSIDRIKSGGDWPRNRQLAMSLQVPFSLFSPTAAVSRTWASYQMTRNSQGGTQQQAGLNGTALDDRFSWSVMQGWSGGSNGNGAGTGILNLGWQGSKGMAGLGYSHSSRYNALNVSASGGLVVHPQGVTLSQQPGNQVALVSAPGAGGVKVMSGNVRTNNRGYAVVPYLSAYQNNTVTLDPSTLPDEVDLQRSSISVYPTKGAVVMAHFATRTGYQALVTLTRNGKPVPFGSLVTVEGLQDNSSIVGDDGQVYLSGLPEHGNLTAVWGPEDGQRCHVAYNLKKTTATENHPVRMLSARCEDK